MKFNKLFLVLLFSIFLLGSFLSQASETAQLDKALGVKKNAELDDDFMEIYLGFVASQGRHHRGARIYDGFFALPAIEVRLFREKIKMRGPITLFELFPKKKFFNTGFKTEYFTDKQIFKLDGDQKAYQTGRKESFEISYFWELRYTKLMGFKAWLSKDLNSHKGNFTTFELFGPFYFKLKDRGDLDTLFKWTFTLGLGDTKHNQYMYGDGANGEGYWSFDIYTLFFETLDTKWSFAFGAQYAEQIGYRVRRANRAKPENSTFTIYTAVARTL